MALRIVDNSDKANEKSRTSRKRQNWPQSDRAKFTLSKPTQVLGNRNLQTAVTEVWCGTELVSSLEQLLVMNTIVETKDKLVFYYQAFDEESKLYPNELKFSSFPRRKKTLFKDRSSCREIKTGIMRKSYLYGNADVNG